MVKLVILGLFTLVLVLVVRAVLNFRLAYAEQVLDDQVGILRARVDYLHNTVYAPGAKFSPDTGDLLKAALNEAKFKLNLLENPREESEPQPADGPNRMLAAIIAIEQAEFFAVAHGIFRRDGASK